ncbi:thioredoxin fold domain-containing protein [Mucilaginibacter sp. CAU 1740]|uniref:thioredoxin family protein n=1 Tax=Mucilaginibacter sp. CAU 1740 TaxID=3140365 RepID=UPI00325BB018
MKRTINLLIAIFLLISNYGYSQGIQFTSAANWSELKGKAKAENKFIFMDAFATWCGPCKTMDKEVFPQAEVGEAFNDKFISVKVQMDKTKSDAELVKGWYNDATAIEKDYSISGYPTYLFFSPEGELVNKVVGAIPAEQLIKESQFALNPKDQYPALLKAFQQHQLAKSDYPKLADLAVKLEQYQVIGPLVTEYYAGLKPNERFDNEHLLFLARFLSKSSDPQFSFLLNNTAKINQALKLKEDREFVKNKVSDIIYNEASAPYIDQQTKKMDYAKIKAALNKYGPRGTAIYKERVEPLYINNEIIIPLSKPGANPDWAKVEKEVVAKYGANGEQAIWDAIAFQYYAKKDVPAFVQMKNKIQRKYPSRIDNFTKGNDAWFVFENAKDSDNTSLQAALKWSKAIVDEEPNNGGNLDTYANLLYRLGYKDESLEWEAKAVKADPLRKEIGENFEKMKRGEPTWPTQPSK